MRQSHSIQGKKSLSVFIWHLSTRGTPPCDLEEDPKFLDYAILTDSLQRCLELQRRTIHKRSALNTLPRGFKQFLFLVLLILSWRKAFPGSMGLGTEATRVGTVPGIRWDSFAFSPFLCFPFQFEFLGPLEGNIPVCRAILVLVVFVAFFSLYSFYT